MRAKSLSRQPSSFKETVRYLTGNKKGLSPDRVEWFYSRNIESPDVDTAAAIMAATAAQSTRCRKPAYHFIIAFDPKDAEEGRINETMMREIAEQAIQKMGLDEYQALIFSHNDEPQPHMHFLVNRVHPGTGKAYSRHNDGKRLIQFCRDVALEHGLNMPRDRSRELEPELTDTNSPGDGEYWQAKREGREPDRPMTKDRVARLREHLAPVFYEADSWDDLSKQLLAHGVYVYRSGQGLRVSDGNGYTKVSAFGKQVTLAKLEVRFKEPFTKYLSRSADESRSQFLKEQLGSSIAPDMPKEERRKAEIVARIDAAQTRTKLDPVVAFDTADIEYRYWAGIERTSKKAQADIRYGYKNRDYLDNLLVAQEEREDRQKKTFLELLEKAFRNPATAAAAYDALESEHGIQDAAQLLAAQPELIGQLHGSRHDKAHRDALKVFKRLAASRRRWRVTLDRAARTRHQLQEAERRFKMAQRDYQMLRLAIGEPSDVARQLRSRIRARAEALNRLSHRMIRQSTFAEERKQQMELALARHEARQKERKRQRERSLTKK